MLLASLESCSPPSLRTKHSLPLTPCDPGISSFMIAPRALLGWVKSSGVPSADISQSALFWEYAPPPPQGCNFGQMICVGSYVQIPMEI